MGPYRRHRRVTERWVLCVPFPCLRGSHGPAQPKKVEVSLNPLSFDVGKHKHVTGSDVIDVYKWFDLHHTAVSYLPLQH